eukprot:505538-Amphidinium_carterae.1
MEQRSVGTPVNVYKCGGAYVVARRNILSMAQVDHLNDDPGARRKAALYDEWADRCYPAATKQCYWEETCISW